MNIIEFSTYEIASLFKTKNFSFNQKTLIKDKTLMIDTMIVVPLYIEASQSYQYNIIKLNHFAYWQEITIIFLLPHRNTEYWFQEWLFDSNQLLYVNRFHLIKKQFISSYISQPIARLQTLVLPIDTVYRDIIPYSYCFVTPQIDLFPPSLYSFEVFNIAFIYDYQNLEYSYDEVTKLSKELKKLFPILQISLLAFPLSTDQLDHIFNTHTVVHFAGHVNPKGLMINASKNYIPYQLISSQVKTKLLFINGCATSSFVLKEFIAKKVDNIVFFTEDQVDILINIDQLLSFYIGIFLGYHVTDAISAIKNKSIRMYGWAHTIFSLI